MNEITKEFDKKENLIYRKEPNGLIYWWEYDENNNLIHVKNSLGREAWYKYDKENEWTEAYYKNTYGEVSWYKINKDGSQTNITKQVIKEKEFLNRKPISRFELIEL